MIHNNGWTARRLTWREVILWLLSGSALKWR